MKITKDIEKDLIYYNGENKDSPNYIERRVINIKGDKVYFIENKLRLNCIKGSAPINFFLNIFNNIIAPGEAKFLNTLHFESNKNITKISNSKIFTTSHNYLSPGYEEASPYAIDNGIVYYMLSRMYIEDYEGVENIEKFNKNILGWSLVPLENAKFVCPSCKTSKYLMGEFCIDCLYENQLADSFDI
ncbi:hypothetical protein [Vallitalea guaymasensis]|uniref:hypothetical protein n=1 Tax=Vallitalea guaymasensis TaxID=1185412 RepID=UPI000DE49C94|nr:hypothetical protein [Vallitalea guaymasensis]